MSFIILFNTVLEVLASAIRQKKERDRNTGEKEIKVFADCLSAYMENPRISTKNYAWYINPGQIQS